MSLADAQAFAFSLASTLMVSIVIFRAGDGSMGVMPAPEFDGDADTIIAELDPFAHEGEGPPLTHRPDRPHRRADALRPSTNKTCSRALPEVVAFRICL
ncbi:hypothetical protein AFEL58S_00436 [Afipia felis]|jgi:hypothetical protein